MDKTRPVPDAAPFGMAFFLASLAVLFLASLTAFLIVRLDSPSWPPPGMPRLPQGLWLSTVILLVSSGTMHWGLRAIRRGSLSQLQKGLTLTALLGFGFLICQLVVWWDLVHADLTVGRNLYGFTFYMLTALHGIHVICGLLPLLVTTGRAYGGRYSAESHMGVRLCAMYWHFLDLAWLGIFAFLVVFA